MAERKKTRKRRAQKKNIIDKTVGAVRKTGADIKKTVAGSKEVAGVTKKVSGAARTLREKVPGVKAKTTAAAAKAADTAKTRVKAVTGSPAAKANERIRARAAGPQQGSTVRQASVDAGRGGRDLPGDRTRAQAQADFEKGTTQKKPGIGKRTLRAGGRQVGRFGGPAAAAAGAEGLIRFGADVADRGFGPAAGDVVEGAGEFVEELPGAAAEFGRDLANRPIRTTAGVGAGILDTAANLGLTIGDVGKAAVGDEPFTEGFKQAQAETRSLRDPFGRALEAISPTEQPAQPTGGAAQDVAATPPRVPGTDQPLPGAAGAQPQPTGLRAAASNREFLADKAKGFRTGFDVLQEAGVQSTGGIGDLAAFNTATRIARNQNQVERAARELNISEAEARSRIEGQTSMNTLRSARARAAQQGADFSVQERVDKVGKEATSILDKYEQLKDTGFRTDSKEAADIKNIEDVTINQALQSNFSPDSASSVAATQMMTSAITPLMDTGVVESTINALVSSGFSAANILDDNGDLAVNRETINLMSVTQDAEGDTIIGMEVPTEDAQGNVISEVRPLFFADDLEPNMRDHMIRVIMRGTGQARTLQNAAR